ncbi:GNAT family N-acetyltransferase [Cellulosilyticum sp. ST5]|uniref:GNAT family N-acetyltransferase n=1 Tax=unclassified Cellulosilyticum TaxID=2643091 RepID=UPI000F8D387F|nr:GNAT family N-acetyltransferase [Cellulosilyticum sp. WCF-2]QEH67318.1 GNAT family N-acetyltransferase [Cellulosilyticum sp. WCF-2]
MNIKLVHTISVEDYNDLRSGVGWETLENEQAQRGIENTYYLVAAIKDERTIGLTRVISDGGYIALIADVIVNPDYQGQGIGKMLVEDALTFIETHLGKDELMVMVSLMAAKGKEKFYEKCGLRVRPNNEAGAGMCLYFNKK